MSQVYRIETVGHFSTYGDSTKGDYLCTVHGDDRELKLFHDTSSNYAPPKVGDEFPGEIKPAKGRGGGWRLSRVSSGGSSSAGGGGGSTGKGDYSPAAIARMSRSHAQEMALMLIAATGDAKDLNLENPAEVGPYLNGTFSRLVRWFEADVEKAGTATKPAEAPAPAQSNGGGEVPADTREMAPAAAAPGDDSIPF